jgi:PTS system cellobiose-specific IIA component
MEAIMHAKAGEFDEAREKLEAASRAMKEAHDTQMDLIGAEVRGEHPELTLLMVHAQDHICMALIVRDMAQEFLELYEKIGK